MHIRQGDICGIKEGTRSGLWSEIIRLSSELRPDYIIVENVANLLSGPSGKPGGWFGRVLGDLAECGYDAEWRNIPAWHVGLPHGRERVWVVAYSAEIRHVGGIFQEDSSKRYEARQAGASLLPPYNARMGSVEDSYSLRKGDGFSEFMGCINALGNAVVPQIPEMIGHAILEAERKREAI